MSFVSCWSSTAAHEFATFDAPHYCSTPRDRTHGPVGKNDDRRPAVALELVFPMLGARRP